MYVQAPVFRRSIDRCDQLLQPHLQRSLIDLLFSGPPPDHDSSGGRADLQSLDDFTQPALFALQYSLAMLWRSWGIVPQVVLGHSVGEFAAACVAGVFGLEDGLMLLCKRARLMNGLPRNGAMAAVFAHEERVLSALRPCGDDVAIAALNGSHVVISGRRERVQAVTESLLAAGLDVRSLNVGHGFHSALMDPILADFEAAVSKVNLSPPATTFISSLTGENAAGELTDASYWRQHVRQPVRFADGIKKLQAAGPRVLIEIGPQPTLLGMTRRILEASGDSQTELAMLPSLRTDCSSWQQMLESLGAVYECGLDIDWASVPGCGEKVALPTYPFQRKRFWVAPRDSDGERLASPASPRLGRRLRLPFSPDEHFEARLSWHSPPYLKDHSVNGVIVVPAGAYLSMAMESAWELHGAKSCTLSGVRFPSALSFSEGDSRVLQLVVSPAAEDGERVRFASLRDEQASFAESSWVTHCTGTIEPRAAASAMPSCLDELIAFHASRNEPLRGASDAGFSVGPSFQWTQSMSKGLDEVVCLMASPLPEQAVEHFQLHPGLIDSSLRTLALCLPEASRNKNEVYAPVKIDTLRFHGKPQAKGALWCHTQATEISEGRIVGDVQLMDDCGQTVMEVLGLEAKRIALSSQFDAAKRDWGNDSLLQVEWERLPAGSATPPLDAAHARWLIVAATGDSVAGLVSVLKVRGAAAQVASKGDTFQRAGKDHFTVDPSDASHWQRLLQQVSAPGAALNLIFYCAAEKGEPPMTASSLKDAQADVGNSLTYLLPMLEASGEVSRLWVVTRGAQAVQPSDAVHPVHSWTWGLGRVVRLECPGWQWLNVDLDPGRVLPEQGSVEEMTMLVDRCFTAGEEDQLAFRGEAAYVPRLVRKTAAPGANPGSPAIHENGSYLITGAFGALGARAARWMVEQGARHLVLVSRTGSLAHPLAAELGQMGAKVLVLGTDLADSESAARLFERVRASMPPIKGILHAAGVLDDGLLRDLSWSRFEHVFGPKVYGTWNLHRQSLDLELDFFVCFSSAVSLIGSKGQGNYAAANSFMDALMHHRRSLGRPGLAINWSVWDEAGMAARMEDRDRERLRAMGLEMIAPHVGLEILGWLIGQDRRKSASCRRTGQDSCPRCSTTRRSCSPSSPLPISRQENKSSRRWKKRDLTSAAKS